VEGLVSGAEAPDLAGLFVRAKALTPETADGLSIWWAKDWRAEARRYTSGLREGKKKERPGDESPGRLLEVGAADQKL
jgi:hypothetical protein